MNIELLATVILLLPVVDWAAVVVMFTLARTGRVAALHERLRTAFFGAIAASLGALLAVLVLTRTRIGPDAFTAILAVIVIAPSLPSLLWLVQWLRNGFRDGDG